MSGDRDAKMLQESAERAVTLLKGLTASREERHAALPLGTEGMPKNELYYCAGLAFNFTTKGGIVLSYEQGHGFVVAKLATSSTQHKRWSAPLFFTTHAGSVGLTVGISVVDSVIVLDTTETVDAFKKRSQASLAADLNLSYANKIGVSMPATAVDLIHPINNTASKSFAYSATKGAMLIDSSLKGVGYRVSVSTNAAVYGKDVTWEDVLDGKVDPPAEFAPLYELLNSMLQNPSTPST